MKRSLVLITLISAAMLTMSASADEAKTHNPKQSKTMTSTATVSSTAASKNAADVVRQFFAAFGKGDVEGVLNTFHSSTSITAVRKGERKPDELHGSYTGKDGAKTFLANLGKTFDTKAFSVDHVVGDEKVAFASGSFLHNIRSTGKPYTSDWALMVVVQDGKILEYHFYEDSASFVSASK